MIVDVHTGGTSCCVVVFAFGYDAAANRYRRARLDTGTGFVARDYDRDRVPRAGGRRLPLPRAVHMRRVRPAADSGSGSYAPAGFDVATRGFPGRIRAHARRMRRFYARARRMGDAALVKGALNAVRGRPVPARPLRGRASGWCARRSGAASWTGARPSTSHRWGARTCAR